MRNLRFVLVLLGLALSSFLGLGYGDFFSDPNIEYVEGPYGNAIILLIILPILIFLGVIKYIVFFRRNRLMKYSFLILIVGTLLPLNLFELFPTKEIATDVYGGFCFLCFFIFLYELKLFITEDGTEIKNVRADSTLLDDSEF